MFDIWQKPHHLRRRNTCNKKNGLLIFTFIFVAILVPIKNSHAQAESKLLDAASGLVMELVIQKPAYSLKAPVYVESKLSNIGKTDIRFLKWNTPFEAQFHAGFFSLNQAGVEVPYTGKMLKRGAPEKSDFILLKSLESISSVLPLNQAYPLTKLGEYSLTFDRLLMLEAGAFAALKSNTVSFMIQDDK